MEWLLALVAVLELCSGEGTDSLQCTEPHEVVKCMLSCPPQPTCRNRRYALPCLPPRQPCTNQCVCADGYARNVDGNCITMEQCDKCPDYTEYFTCDGDYSENCVGSCLCDSGYVRDANNTCVSTAPPAPIVKPPTPPSNPTTPAEPPSDQIISESAPPSNENGTTSGPFPADLYFYENNPSCT